MRQKQTIPSPVTFSKHDVQLISKETNFQGFFRLNTYTFRHKKFNGEWSEPVQRELFERGHAVALLPYDSKRDRVILIEQIRIGALETSQTPWLLELVAGMIEPDETKEHVARREAMEEAGLTVQRCQPILSYLASPGGMSERLSLFVGEVDATQASGIHGLAEEQEDIKVHVVSRQQAYQWVEQGIIDNAASIIALQWLQLNYQTLQQTWQTTE